MACFRPLKGYRSKTVNPATGKRSIVFNIRHALLDPVIPVDLPCGQCMGCRLERSRQWAIRCVHEASLHERNCFITLTYAPEHLPQDRSLNVKHFQDFMKRLRFKFGEGIRFFHCGEYGDKGGRPHYHACIFNFDFKDKKLWTTRDSVKLYTSQDLQDLWGKGFTTVGDVTFDSAAYVARYVTKKITGDRAAEHYSWIDDRGEIHSRTPEYTTMSRRPGIGKGWFEKYSTDCYPHDFLVLRGKRMRPPKYYDRLFDIASPLDFSKITFKRKSEGKAHSASEHYTRLAVKEECQAISFKLLKRGYESG